jgi:hypothetical protein
MKAIAIRIGTTAILLALLGTPSDSRAFTENHWMHRSQAFQVCALGKCFWADHTWGESAGDSSCTDDMVQSRANTWDGTPNTYCYSHNQGNSACAWARRSYTAQAHYSNGTSSCSQVWGIYGNCYANANNGVYAVNGVCHQASNRAFSRTWVPWVRDLGWIAGGWESFLLYYDYGAWTPGGAAWDQGC